MTNNDLLLTLEQIEKQWYNDFKGTIFEDSNFLIYNEDTEQNEIDTELLTIELNLIINEYMPVWIEEAEQEEKALYEKHLEVFKNLLSEV